LAAGVAAVSRVTIKTWRRAFSAAASLAIQPSGNFSLRASASDTGTSSAPNERNSLPRSTLRSMS